MIEELREKWKKGKIATKDYIKALSKIIAEAEFDKMCAEKNIGK